MLLVTTQLRQVIGTWGIDVPVVGEDVTGFKLDHDVTVREAQTVLRGVSGASITWSILYDVDRTAAGTHVFSGEVTDGAAALTSGISHSPPVNAVIPAGNWVWLEVSAIFFPPLEFTVTLWA